MLAGVRHELLKLLRRRRTEQDELPNVDALARMTFKDSPLVTPPAGKQAVVMERNEMTIVWLYEQEKP